jgi:hypothetical protein
MEHAGNTTIANLCVYSHLVWLLIVVPAPRTSSDVFESQ